MLDALTKATFCAVRAHAHARVPTIREALEFCGCYAAALTLAFGFTFLVGSQNWVPDFRHPPAIWD
jgi:hypothetical protein